MAMVASTLRMSSATSDKAELAGAAGVAKGLGVQKPARAGGQRLGMQPGKTKEL